MPATSGRVRAATTSTIVSVAGTLNTPGLGWNAGSFQNTPAPNTATATSTISTTTTPMIMPITACRAAFALAADMNF